MAYATRAAIRLQMGDYAGANRDATESLRLDSQQPSDSYMIRAIAKYNLQDYPGALEDNTKAIELAPSHALAYANRAGTKRKLGDVPGALNDCHG